MEKSSAPPAKTDATTPAVITPHESWSNEEESILQGFIDEIFALGTKSRQEAADDLNRYREKNGKEPRTLDSIRTKINRIYNARQGSQGAPLLPGPFDTESAQEAVAATLAEANEELTMLGRKRQYHEEFGKIQRRKQKYADKRNPEMLRRRAFDEESGEELKKIRLMERRFQQKFGGSGDSGGGSGGSNDCA